MRALRLFALALLVVAGGCFIGAGSFAGKGCESNNDCPDPYVCAQVRPGGRSCELVHGIELASGGTGGGGNLPPDYCHDVKPILDRTCVSNCHGPDNTGSSLPHRFDTYAFDGGTPLAAFELAARIKARVSADDMPPSFPLGSPRPDPAERALIIRWVNAGALECNDGGALSDAGTDGGTDGG